MGWSAELNQNSAAGESIRFTPDTAAQGEYSVAAFTAPKNGVYRFDLSGSGGAMGSTQCGADGTFETANLSGGRGGATSGYLSMKKGETVYVGAGGACSAAFVSAAYAQRLSSAGHDELYFVAGAGGAAGRCYRGADYTQYGTGGNGGGASGANGTSSNDAEENGGAGGTAGAGGSGGTQGDSDGAAGGYGAGGSGAYMQTHGCPAWGGRGGDGYYGGGGGGCTAAHASDRDVTHSYGFGGGGGSGYFRTRTLTVLGRTYTSSTTQGAGAQAGGAGSVKVTFAARTLLPVFFDGVQLEKIFFNGTQAESLVFNGNTIYARAMRLYAALFARRRIARERGMAR